MKKEVREEERKTKRKGERIRTVFAANMMNIKTKKLSLGGGAFCT